MNDDYLNIDLFYIIYYSIIFHRIFDKSDNKFDQNKLK